MILQNQENIDNIAVYDDCESGIDYQFYIIWPCQNIIFDHFKEI